MKQNLVETKINKIEWKYNILTKFYLSTQILNVYVLNICRIFLTKRDIHRYGVS